MTIIFQNSLVNQYVPTFYIKDLMDGQGLVYDSVRRAFVNSNLVSANSGSGATRLGQLLDVSSAVDNPLALQNGQTLVYNTTTTLWENTFLDYNHLQNRPTSANYRFSGLADTSHVPVPNGFVRWNSNGTQLVYTTDIPSSSVTGLASVAYSGDYNDLINKPVTQGTVTSITVLPGNGISGVVASPNTTPEITLTLGNITPQSISSTGPVSGSNLSGTNTGDQTITLTGDVFGSGTGPINAQLAVVNTNIGTFGSSTQVPRITVDSKGRITSVASIPLETGTGTVQSVSLSVNNGIIGSITNPTTNPSIILGLGNITPLNVTASGVISASNLSGTNTGDQTITLTGDVTGSGTGSFTTTLATVNNQPGTYGNSRSVPRVSVNSKGLVTSVSSQPVDTSIRDIVEPQEVLVIAPRHQYIVTSRLEVLGRIENNGRIAVL